MEDIRAKIERLNNTNYSVWKFRVELLLRKENLWGVVNEPKPEVPDADWMEQNGKALVLIGLLLDDNQLQYVRRLEYAFEYWNALKSNHERATLTNKVSVLKSICRLKLDEKGSMSEHLSQMSELSEKLHQMGEPIKDSLLIAFMLSSLPDSYNSIVMALEARPENELSIEMVKEKLLQEDLRRRVNSSNSNIDVAMKTRTKIKPKFFKCFNCDQVGHIQRNCTLPKRNVNSNSKQAKPSSSHAKMVTNVCFNTGNTDKNAWYIDSASTTHISCDRDYFIEIKNHSESVYLANGNLLLAIGIGDCRLNLNCGGSVLECTIKDVLYVPEMQGNLLSVHKLVQKGFCVSFDNEGCQIKLNNEIIAIAKSNKCLYKLDLNPKFKHSVRIAKAGLDVWHRRFGHRDLNALKKIDKHNLVEDIKIVNCNVDKCETCLLGKICRKSFPQESNSKTSETFQLVHTDVCGPMKTKTPSGNTYFLTLIDDFSRYSFIYLLKEKNEVTEKYKEFVNEIKTQFGKSIKILRSDNGGEYVSQDLLQILKENGTRHEFTVPDSPQQNGVAERKNRYLSEMANCMLIDGSLPKRFWGEAIVTANYLQNRLPVSFHNSTPFEKLFGKKPKLGHVRIFGSLVYSRKLSYVPKFENKAEKLCLVGYCDTSKGYRLVDVYSNRVYVRRDVEFIENSVLNSNEDVNESLNENNVDDVTINLSSPSESNVRVDDDDSFVSAEDIENVIIDEPETKRDANVCSHSPLLYDDYDEPKTYEDVLNHEDKDEWLQAMREEIDCMEDCNAWTLIENNDNKRVIDTKWVFKLKIDPINNEKRYKARLVARGFSQKFGEDYDEVFAPVVRQETWRTLLTISGIKNYHVKHFDIKTAFLYGDLEETIFIKQPKGFENKNKNFVCKLNKSLYGLKQSAKNWNNKIDSILKQDGFSRSEVDMCLYTKKVEDKIIYILVYVDDLNVATNCEKLLYDIELLLVKNFRIKNLGDISFYLGIEINRYEDGIFRIHQKTYINKLLKVFKIEDAKGSKIPLDTGYFKNEAGKDLLENNVQYRKAIGSLLYLAVNTRPDIAVAVSILSRKVESPSNKDWTEVKRLLKYLKTTQDEKLKLGGSSDYGTSFLAYSDADWAGDTIDRRSTSGFVIKLFNSAVSWRSQKQPTVSLSSTEAEYIALTETCKEVLWFIGLLKDMFIDVNIPIVYEDNQSALTLLDTSGVKTRSKHIDVKYHFARDLKSSGKILFEYCPTHNMLADMMTKPLTADHLKKLKFILGIEIEQGCWK